MIIRTDELKEVCGVIGKAISTSLKVPMSDVLLLSTDDDNKLCASISDGEFFVTTKIADCEEKFNAAIAANTFLKLVLGSTSETIELTQTQSFLKVVGNGEYKIPFIADEDILPVKMSIESVTSSFDLNQDILSSILDFNIKEIAKRSDGVSLQPIQTLCYLDDCGAITFTSGACVNNFTIPEKISVLLTSKVIQLFRLFPATAKCTVGTAIGVDGAECTRISIVDDNTYLCTYIVATESFMRGFPVSAIRKRANAEYPYEVTLDRELVLQAVSRLLLFNDFAKNKDAYYKMSFNNARVSISSLTDSCREEIYYAERNSGISSYDLVLNLSHFKMTINAYHTNEFNIHFGNGECIVTTSGNITNIIQEICE